MIWVLKCIAVLGMVYRINNEERYKDILLESAKTLITRFNERVVCIKSWDWAFERWPFPVIIDNMMNLELLFWATRVSGDSTFYRIALNHALTTIDNHFRKDYSSYHVVNFDTLTGKANKKETHQGYSNESAWSRGQAWGLYGFTMCFRETGDERFLEQAKEIARFIMTHPNQPEYLIPYYDYDAPGIPDEPRDASTAAVIPSALIELYTITSDANYLSYADEILNSLSSSKYFIRDLSESTFLLRHSTGSKPGNSEINVPIIYADYYFVEALMRRIQLN